MDTNASLQHRLDEIKVGNTVTLLNKEGEADRVTVLAVSSENAQGKHFVGQCPVTGCVAAVFQHEAYVTASITYMGRDWVEMMAQAKENADEPCE